MHICAAVYRVTCSRAFAFRDLKQFFALVCFIFLMLFFCIKCASFALHATKVELIF